MPPKPERHSARLTLRLSARLLAAAERAADRAGLTLPEFVRAALSKHAGALFPRRKGNK